LYDAVQKYDVKFVDWISPLVAQYNRQVQTDQELTVKTRCKPLTFDWTIPEKYAKLDIVQHIADKHWAVLRTCPEQEWEDRELRLVSELRNYQKRNLYGVLRVIIFVINTLTDNDIVWGVGRGSSVSSYVLYVIGVHDVDSFAYDLDVDDFLHD